VVVISVVYPATHHNRRVPWTRVADPPGEGGTTGHLLRRDSVARPVRTDATRCPKHNGGAPTKEGTDPRTGSRHTGVPPEEGTAPRTGSRHTGVQQGQGDRAPGTLETTKGNRSLTKTGSWTHPGDSRTGSRTGRRQRSPPTPTPRQSRNPPCAETSMRPKGTGPTGKPVAGQPPPAPHKMARKGGGSPLAHTHSKSQHVPVPPASTPRRSS
jgi:hypothetical protein